MARVSGNLLSKDDVVRQARWTNAFELTRERSGLFGWEWQPRIVKGEIIAAYITCEGSNPFEIPVAAMDELAVFMLGGDDKVHVLPKVPRVPIGE